MNIALSIPCFIEKFYPEVADSVIELMHSLGIEFTVPEGQTCCGQPLANSGFEQKAIGAYKHYTNIFGSFDKTLMISGSCSYHIKEHYDIIDQTTEVRRLRNNIQDVTEYVSDNYLSLLKPVSFPYKVALHTGCHSLRGMRMGTSSELAKPTHSFLKPLVDHIPDIEVKELDRPDECCGFGGTFSVYYPEISVRMGKDKLDDAMDKGIEIILSNDMSCLLHLDGIIKKRNLPIKTMHILQVLNGDKPIL